jgi:hypothetical protein
MELGLPGPKTAHWEFKRVSPNVWLCRRRLDLFEFNTLPMKSTVSREGDRVTVEVRLALSVSVFIGIWFLLFVGNAIWHATQSVLITTIGTASSAGLSKLATTRERSRAVTILDELEQWLKQAAA